MQYDQIDDWRRIKFDLHKKPSVWNIKNWELHGNEAPCHTSITINDFLCEYYCAFQFSLFGWHKSLWLFPLTEINHVKGRHFGKLKNIQRLLTAMLFRHCHEAWMNTYHVAWQPEIFDSKEIISESTVSQIRKLIKTHLISMKIFHDVSTFKILANSHITFSQFEK